MAIDQKAGVEPVTVTPEGRGVVRRRWDAKPVMEGGEFALVYFHTDKMVVAASTLPPGQKSLHDPGHVGAHEVVYCISGEIVVELSGGEEPEYLHIAAGDAGFINDRVPHTVFNPGSEPAHMFWCTAPTLGRPVYYEG